MLEYLLTVFLLGRGNLYLPKIYPLGKKSLTKAHKPIIFYLRGKEMRARSGDYFQDAKAGKGAQRVRQGG
jgi:hypothetical protein